MYVFNVFLEIYSHSGGDGGITFSDIKVWCDIRRTELKQIEIDYIMKCSLWAEKEISVLEKAEEE